MICATCGQENSPEASFCEECGTRLSPTCPSCGLEVRPVARFCRGCGSALLAQQPPPAVQTPPATSATPPTAFANGRYQVKRFLGEGGKKKVYLAHDTLLDRDVAFALIKTEGLDEASRTRITREAQAMGRLGSHPHIVTVFDLGQEQGQPFMVTELMGGGDVEGVIEKAPDHRLSLPQVINIARETCRGLEFAHQRGIVHRDLKPGNVWLTAEGTAKIGDFGLAVAVDRSRLTTEGMMVGTVSYMPPEQAMGGEVTPRADLYSLGAMLYEMVTGRPPFLGDDSVAIIGQHINTPPVAPTWHNPRCPRPLEALVLRLLAKDPAQRPQSGADVLAALEALDLADVAAEGEHPADDAHSLDSLAGVVFVGRQREMGELKAALEEALSGRGRLVTLVGEPGIGKTRTAQELAVYAGLRGARVLWGRCYEEQGMPPYWPWVQAIRSYVREGEPDRLRSELGAGAADIAQVVSEVKERLPGLEPPPPLDSPEQARFRLFDSITAFLKAAARQQPLVLLLDDLHWADQPSLLLLQFVVSELSSGGRILLVGAYRDMELSRQHPLAETLGALTRERLFQRVLLRGLSREDVGRFIEVATGFGPPSELVRLVYAETEGNPLFVTEVVRLLVQEGELSAARARGRDSWSVRIPEGVREVIGRRLNRLSQRCYETLTMASVIGREFAMGQLKPLVDDPSAGSGLAASEDRLLEVLEEALSARVIEELPRSVGHYQFTHALIQETLMSELSLTRRVRLHARIAQELEKLYGVQAEAHAAELAHHFGQAQAILGPEKVVQYALLAGERALATYAYEDALAHFQRGLAAKGAPTTGSQPVADAEEAALMFGLGRAQAATLQSEVACGSLSRAFDYYMELADVESLIAVAESPLPHLPGQLTRAPEFITRTLALVPTDSLIAGRLLSLRCTELGIDGGDYEGAQEAFGRALAIAQRQKDGMLELQTLARACSVDAYHLRLQKSLETGLQVIKLARNLGDPICEVPSRFFTALALWSTGDLEGAKMNAAECMSLAEELRDRFWLASAYWANEIVCSLQGNYANARTFNDRGLALLPRDPRLLGTRALIEFDSGNFDQGEAHLERLFDAMRLSPPGASFEYAFVASVAPPIGRIAGLMDRLDVAERAGRSVLDSSSVTPLVAIRAQTGLAWLAVLRGDAGAAAERYGDLAPRQGTVTPGGMFSMDRLLGLLSHTMGNLDQAAGHFEDALAFCRSAGYRPLLAWSLCDYADTLLARQQPGDGQRAMALLDESLAIARELGMRPLMERALSRREILKA